MIRPEVIEQRRAAMWSRISPKERSVIAQAAGVQAMQWADLSADDRRRIVAACSVIRGGFDAVEALAPQSFAEYREARGAA